MGTPPLLQIIACAIAYDKYKSKYLQYIFLTFLRVLYKVVAAQHLYGAYHISFPLTAAPPEILLVGQPFAR